jgi:RNA polymerase sigma-70 factor (ECF subfamily)
MDTTNASAWNGLAELEPLVRSWLRRRMREGSDLDDAVQETLLRAARFRARGHLPRKLEGWLVRIAANTVHDRARRAGRFRALGDGDLSLDDLASPESVHESACDSESWQLGPHHVTRDGALELLEAAVGELRDEDRALLRSYYDDGKRCAEVAREFGFPGPRAKMRLFRARRRLARRMEGRLSREESKPWCA